ncbi:AAA family ATPase [Cellulomonas soli]|uniref:Nuclease SbcCD subunit C n=1 Tax=Cellulomonas soli TaxID=931535 RepID=A0A512PCP8_9CELL|nr:SMC family ATPase [Cellulomonas soli]NYI58553.1 exonuclease SbcC [Cellulomonas soli]GEP68977.1 nuclease SbcCD subunit C [Cellulomonas soli]
MHLRSLTLRAVGPFADEHTIDFDALATSGLFLLEGPTGSGKSTLIDAIVFALYGKVASAEASEDRLRSAYAPDDIESVVDLVFEVPAGVFRVRRTPQYQRAKKRGSGTTTAQATVKAWRLPTDVDPCAGPDVLDAVGTPLGNRLDEVGAEIQRLVGLDRQQFVQTIVLPQGEFARFLRANPEDRRGLLQKIFGTEVYERLQVRLAEMRREHDRAVEAGRAALDRSVAHLIGAARWEDVEADELRTAAAGVTAGSADVADAGLGIHTVVTARVAVLDEQAAQASDVAALAEQVVAAARTRLDEESARAAVLTRRHALRQDRAALDAAADEHRAAVARLARAHAARTVGPLLTGADTARTAVGAAHKAVRAAIDAAPADLASLVGDLPSDGGDLTAPRAALEHDRDLTVGTVATLRRAVDVEAGLDAERHRVRAARDAIEDTHALLALHDAWLAERPQARGALVDALAVARTAAARVGEHEAALAAAGATVQVVEDLDAARREHERADAARTRAVTLATAAVDHERTLRTARIAGLAGELASVLVDGDPCPVCGATEHLAKAVVGADHVQAADVDLAEQARAAAEAGLTAAAEAATRWAERLHVLLDQVAASPVGSVDGADRVDRARTHLVAAQGALDAARQAVDEVARLDVDLAAFDASTTVRQSERTATATALAAAEAALDAQVAALDEHEAEVVEARGPHPTVAARHGELVERVAAAQDLLDALADLVSAHDDDTRRGAELALALDAHGFPHAEAARDAHLDGPLLTTLERQVAEHVAAVAAVTAGLAEPDVAALPEDAEADVEGARAAEAVARQTAQQAAALARTATDRAAGARAAATAVLADADALGRAIAAGAPVARLATLAAGTGGDNARHLSLATYVLVRRFEDVVAAANDRLLTMSDGRYELVRSDEKEDVRARATGLAMRVVDHRTEQPRDPRTLSGGETFYVSLCLALGMADVVTAEAGGIDLGTLFVDEGFGSLDPHVLDQVLVELGRLRAGGRVVGLVSHVETLKQAIADRIEVRPTAAGPSTLRVLAS